MNLKQISGFLAGPGGFLVLIFFFLPWVSVSCNGAELFGVDEKIMSGSGYDLAAGFDEGNVNLSADDIGIPESEFEGSIDSGEIGFGDGEDSEFNGDSLMYAFPIIGLIGLALAGIGFFEPRILNPISGFALYIIPAIIGLGLMVVKYMALADEIDKANVDAAAQQAEQGAEFSLNLAPEILKLNIELGWMLSGVGLVFLIIAGIIVFLSQEEAQPVGASNRASPTQSIPKSDEGEGLGGFMGKSYDEPPPKPSGGSIKEQFAEARDLIQQKRYGEARAILEQIDHPKAQEWLDKLKGR